MTRRGAFLYGADRSRLGQMSFALAAVLIMVLAGASVAVLSSIEDHKQSSRDLDAYLESMLRMAEEERMVLERKAYAEALRTVQSNPLANESTLGSLFEASWNERLRVDYPRYSSSFSLDVQRSSVALSFLRLSASEVTQWGQSGGGIAQLTNVTIPSYLTVTGNVTFNVSCGNGYLLKTEDMDSRLYLPVPLLQNRLEAFASAVSGDKNHFENIVRYELSALVQKRALARLDRFGLCSPTALLTEQDVENAVNLAVVLEEVRLFRNYDLSNTFSILAGMASSEEALQRTERTLASRGQLDPADLFLSLLGEDQLDTRTVVAQSLFAAADGLVLRWLDYLHVMDLGRFLEGAAESVQLTISNVLSALFGGDPTNELALDWMRKRLDAAGVPESEYRYLNCGSPDFLIEIPHRTISVLNDDGETVLFELEGLQELDFPSLDLISSPEWRSFYVDYKASTFEMGEALEQFVKSVAMGVAENLDLEQVGLRLDPMDQECFLSELDEALEGALSAGNGWLDLAVAKASHAQRLHDGMALAFVTFVSSRWMEIFQANRSVNWALSKMAYQLANDSLAGEGFGPEALKAAGQSIAWDMVLDTSWGIRETAMEALYRRVEGRIQLFDAVFSNVTIDGQGFSLNDAVVRLALGAIGRVPGAGEVVRRLAMRMIDDLEQGSRLRGDKVTIALHGLGPLPLRLENEVVAKEELLPQVQMPWTTGDGLLEVSIKYPFQYAREAEDYPNRHVTDLNNLTLCPFQSQFEVAVRGQLQLTLGCSGELSSIAGGSPQASANVPFDFRFGLCTSSGWPLDGVDYRPTMTALKQVEQVFQAIWDGIVGALQWAWDGINSIFSFLQDVVSTVLSYAMQAVQWLSDLVTQVVQGIKDILESGFSSFAEWLGRTVTDTVGKIKVSFSLLGIQFLLETDVNDIPYGRSRDYLRLTGTVDLGGTKLSLTMRVASIYKKGTDIVFNGTMLGDGWVAKGTFDPLMIVCDHLFELVGSFPSFVIELCMPKIVQYDVLRFSLADVPGIGAFLSRIPLPIPGLTGSIDAGFELKYNRPINDHVVINEVELNPQGADAGREWVELYNPSAVDVEVSGWYLETSHGSQEVDAIEDEVIPPRGYLVHVFPELMLDNGGEHDAPLGESVVLRDASGTKVDSTQFLTDYYGDGRTWQRKTDGAESWTFKDGTRGSRNHFQTVVMNDRDVMMHALGEAALRAFGRFASANAFSLDSLASLITGVIKEVLDTMIDILADAVVEMGLFLELKLQDCTQSFSGSLRLSLLVTGDFVREGLQWIADAVRSALCGFANPAAAMPKAHSLDELLDDVYIRFGAYGQAGLPRILGSIGDGVKFSFGGQIQVNLAAFIPPRHGPQNWSVVFGVLFEGIDGRYLSPLFNTDADKLVDCWVLWASLHANGQNQGNAIEVRGM